MEPDQTAPQAKNSEATFFICLLLAAVTLVVYWPVVHAEFVNYDDPLYFTSNPHVLMGLTSGNMAWAFTTGYAANWHPVTWLSLMLDARVFGKGPFGPHLTNILLHAANTVLLFLLLRRLTSATWRSVLVAGLFALHPLHVESVAWVTERKDVLSAFFGLLSLCAYVRYAQERSRVEGRESSAGSPGLALDPQRWALAYSLAILFFALGLMSKPVLVTLPLVMLLLDWWPLQRMSSDRWQMTGNKTGLDGVSPHPLFTGLVTEKIPFFALSIFSCVVTFVVQQKGGVMATLTKFSLSERIGNAFVSYARYLGKVFWPGSLAVPYPYPGHWPLALVLLSVTLFFALCIAAVWCGRRFPFAPTGWFWFVGMLVPVIGLVQVSDQSMADRYTYLPLIGVFLVLVWGAGAACAHWRTPRPTVIFFSAFLLAACAAWTRGQLLYWQNSGALFRHARAVTKDNYVAENNLGTWLAAQGKVADAIDCYRESLRIKPDNVDALFDLGNAFARLGDWTNAVANYHRALELAPNQADVLDNLGFVLATKRQYAEAITNFEAALKLNPDSIGAHNNLATVLFMQQRYDEAAQHYREALRLAPDNPGIQANLGDTLVRLGRKAEAMECYQAALRLNPGDARIQAKLQALEAPVNVTSPAN